MVKIARESLGVDDFVAVSGVIYSELGEYELSVG